MRHTLDLSFALTLTRYCLAGPHFLKLELAVG
jgi:hypothetical protein